MTSIDAQPRTLTAVLERRLVREPDAVVCHLVDGEDNADPVSVRRLMNKAMAYAERLGRAGAERKVVAIVLHHGLDLHAAFLGALWAGHIPTVLPPPSPRMETAKYVGAFGHMLERIQPFRTVIDSTAHDRLRSLGPTLSLPAHLVQAESVPSEGVAAPWPARPHDIALLQHSSGTTGFQKGVTLSHRAILEHNRAYARRLRLTQRDIIVSWLPLYHDMGLIACFLLPLLEGLPFVEISPFDWVLRPAVLLEQIKRFRATLCWMPNFAYALLADRLSDGPVPDVSSIRAWVNCSEPVYDSSHRRFAQRLGLSGVRAGELTASYAMAENVFAVSQSQPGVNRTFTASRRLFTEQHRIESAGADEGLTFVSCGPPIETTEVAVAGDNGEWLAEDRVGELCIRGSHLSDGYFKQDDAAAAAITPDGWFRTGDLGFLHDGEVYVTGRLKDLLILNGRNYYPADIEGVVSTVDGVVDGRVVAFGLPDEERGTERLIILAELAPAFASHEPEIALRIRQVVAQQLGCVPSDVRGVPPRWLVKSTSGKLARADNRTRYLAQLAVGVTRQSTHVQ